MATTEEALRGAFFKASDFIEGEARDYVISSLEEREFEEFKQGKKTGGMVKKWVLAFEDCEQELILNATNIKSIGRFLGRQMTPDDGSSDSWVNGGVCLFRMEDVQNSQGNAPALRVRKAA